MSIRKASMKNRSSRMETKITMNPRSFKFFVVSFVLALFWATSASAFDFSGWDGLLKKYVKPTTLEGVRLNAIPYKKVGSDPAYKAVVKGLASFSPSALQTREEKLAFWINVYNIMAAKMVLDHYPLESIKDAGGLFDPVWKKVVGKVGGKDVTLHQIEHEILRKMGEPRIHVAIVCASVSCPDIRPEAYTAELLDSQLTDQMQKFLQNRGKGMKVEGGDSVRLSSIFKWFSEDFESKGGVLKFIAPYAPKAQQGLLRKSDVDISYLDYNWNLNNL